MKIKILFSIFLSLSLIGCGGSSGGGSSEPLSGTNTSLLSSSDVIAMTDALAAVNQLKNSTDGLNGEPETVPFLVRLSSGEEQVIATQGPLELKATCDSHVKLVFSSTVLGSLAEIERGYMLEQNTDYVFGDVSRASTDVSSDSIDQGGILAPSGDAILINGESILYGANIQGSDCLVAGSIMVMKGDGAPAFDAPSLPTL